MAALLSLAVATELITSARLRAQSLGLLVSVAVVDAGGHLIGFSRMDGAEIAGPTLAVDKAYTAVAQSTSTAELAVLAAPGGDLFGLHANGNGRYVIFGGGIPLLSNGTIVGGIGVSGASSLHDDLCAQAGVERFEELTSSSTRPQ